MKKPKRPRLLLIDGDILAFRIAVLANKGPDWDGDGVTYQPADHRECVREVQRYVRYLERKLDARSSIVCMSDSKRSYFRHTLFPEYKLNRTQGTPPPVLGEIKDAMRTLSQWRSRLEADDVLGIYATDPDTIGRYEPVIVSDDKDLLQFPGKHYRIRLRGNDEWKVVSDDEASWNFWKQVLMGDPTDGIPGIRGVGPKKAEKILTYADWDNKTLGIWPDVVEAYGGDEERALLMARLVYLLRSTDYDEPTGKVKLWSPNSLSDSSWV